MKYLKEVTKVRHRSSENVLRSGPVKLLGGLAVGAVILAGTALYFGPNQFHGKDSSIGVDSALPKTAYYQDPDWREREAAEGEVSRAAHNPSTAAISSNEIAENFSRIREEGRQADRQDDLRDMTRYWDQLKRDAASGSTSYYDEDENERAYDELRQSFTGIPHNDLREDDFPGNLAWWPFGSLLPDTEYYRNPDWNERQMHTSTK